MSDDDMMYWSRLIMASNRGTLMELGISPIVSAGMFLQIAVGAKIIDIDTSDPEQKALHDKIEKLLAIVIATFEAVAYVFSGQYGQISQIGAVSGILIIIQLVFASILVILLDEILKSGYGIISAISLFIATNVCEDFVWSCISPYQTGNGEYIGAFVNLFAGLKNDPSK